MDFDFETNGLYLLLSDRGDVYTFHWALFLATTRKAGEMFHLVNADSNADSATTWRFEHEFSSTTASLGSVILALKVAVMDPVLHGPLRDRLAQIPIQDFPLS